LYSLAIDNSFSVYFSIDGLTLNNLNLRLHGLRSSIGLALSFYGTVAVAWESRAYSQKLFAISQLPGIRSRGSSLSLNHFEGATTVLFTPRTADHQENVLFEIIEYLD